MNDLWGPIDPREWRTVPSIYGRSATEADVNLGRAVFYVDDASAPISLDLPRCAFQLMDDGVEQPVVVIQVEQTEEGVILGVRPLNGGNGICMAAEIRYLAEGFDLNLMPNQSFNPDAPKPVG